MSKPILSLVWIAGPLAGLIVQPLAGAVSDYWQSRAGRRRPFIMASTIAAIAALLVFAWAPEIANWSSGSGPGSRAGQLSLIIATMAVLVVDIAINVCSACTRALIVDVFPASRQNDVQSWAGRMSAGGHLGSYFLGSSNVLEFGFSSQVKGVCVISSVFFLFGSMITCLSVKERQLVSANSLGLSTRFGQLLSKFFHVTVHLDKVLASIFKVQLFGWYAWFTFLFYGATWAGEIWRHQTGSKDSDSMARHGAQALLGFSISTTIFSVVLPMLPVDITLLWSLSYIVYAITAFATGFVSKFWQALICTAVIGLPWAMTLWAPFALTSQRIHQLPVLKSTESDVESIETHLTVMSSGSEMVGHNSDAPDEPHVMPANQGDVTAENSGIYLGIHNSTITLPQFVSTLGSFIVFRVFATDSDSGSGSRDDAGRAVAVTLQVGGIAALFAAYYAYNVRSAKTDYEALPDTEDNAVSSPDNSSEDSMFE